MALTDYTVLPKVPHDATAEQTFGAGYQFMTSPARCVAGLTEIEPYVKCAGYSSGGRTYVVCASTDFYAANNNIILAADRTSFIGDFTVRTDSKTGLYWSDIENVSTPAADLIIYESFDACLAAMNDGIWTDPTPPEPPTPTDTKRRKIMFNGGYAMIDGKGLFIGVATEGTPVTIDGIFDEFKTAVELKKPVVLHNVKFTSDDVNTLSPIYVIVVPEEGTPESFSCYISPFAHIIIREGDEVEVEVTE